MAASLNQGPRAAEAGFRAAKQLAHDTWLSLLDGATAREAGLYPGTICAVLVVRDPGGDVAEFRTVNAAKRAIRQVQAGKETWDSHLPDRRDYPIRTPIVVEDVERYDEEITGALIGGIPTEDILDVYRRALVARKWVRTGGEDYTSVDDHAIQLKAASDLLSQIRGSPPQRHIVSRDKGTFDGEEFLADLARQPALLEAVKLAIEMAQSAQPPDPTPGRDDPPKH